MKKSWALKYFARIFDKKLDKKANSIFVFKNKINNTILKKFNKI